MRTKARTIRSLQRSTCNTSQNPPDIRRDLSNDCFKHEILMRRYEPDPLPLRSVEPSILDGLALPMPEPARP